MHSISVTYQYFIYISDFSNFGSGICGCLFWKIIPFIPKLMAVVVICTICAENQAHSHFTSVGKRNNEAPPLLER